MFSKTATDYYYKHSQYKTYPEKCEFLNYYDGTFTFDGIEDKMARFIENVQLKDRNLWKLFVNQFRKGDVDVADLGW